MYANLVVMLLMSVCHALEPSIVSVIDSNELYTENDTQNIQFIFPTIDPSIAEDTKLTTPQLIEKYGYNAEVHYVTTEDGYILQLHRIAGGRKFPPRKGKKVCFLEHGLLDSSATWVISGPNHGLAYILADLDYDIWLGNNRGNRYCLNHTKYDPFGSRKEQQQFWSFSWHEIGYYDVPAMIDYILDETEQKSVQYIGHSQGTTAFFVLTSEKPEYNDKIEMMHALAPVAFLSHVISPPIRIIAPFISIVEKMASFLGVNYITPSNEYLLLAGKAMCRDGAPTQIICENLLFLMMGYTSDQLNATLLPVILAHTPAGSATNQMLHYGQEVNSGHFRQYDHGRIGNLRRYKRLTPPDYNLNNVRAPVAVYYSRDDWLAVVDDVDILIKKLPNVVNTYLVPHKKFNHIDFLWGIDVPFLVYDEVIRTMNESVLLDKMEHDISNSV